MLAVCRTRSTRVLNRRVTVVYALLAALGNALNVTTQHAASISSPKKTTGWHLVGYLFRNPLWLSGWIALAAAFVFQALALHAGQLSVVQPLLVTELVFALVLRRAWLHQRIRPITWWAAAVTCLSLAVFLAAAEPQGGRPVPDDRVWIAASATTVGAAAALALLGTRGTATRRAALFGSATAAMWALVATLIKTMTESLTQFGVGGMFGHWPVYALAGAGLATEILEQATLHAGPLSVSQPFLVIVDPIVSIALSVWIFGEYFTENPLRLILGAISFVVMGAAVAALTTTAPATMSAASPPPGASKADGPGRQQPCDTLYREVRSR
jgi:drug/metabolite transporter (DMT)-like permease